MTLEEAIEINEDLVPDLNIMQSPMRAHAVQLGAEALKYIKQWRLPGHGGATILLPGETKE